MVEVPMVEIPLVKVELVEIPPKTRKITIQKGPSLP